MNRPQSIATRPQMALQSYLDGLLQEATDELTVTEPVIAPPPVVTVVALTVGELLGSAIPAEQLHGIHVPLEEATDAEIATADEAQVVHHRAEAFLGALEMIATGIDWRISREQARIPQERHALYRKIGSGIVSRP